MAAICFFSGVNLLFMGVIGEYIGRIFLGMSNNPQFVVRCVHEQGAEEKPLTQAELRLKKEGETVSHTEKEVKEEELAAHEHGKN